MRRAFRRCFRTPQATIPVTVATRTTHKPTPSPIPVFGVRFFASAVGALGCIVGLLPAKLVIEGTEDGSGPGKKSDGVEADCLKVVSFFCV